MPDQTCSYLIVGGGLAGASAVRGIRSLDQDGSILLVGNEPHRPYNRPPLTKELWFGKKQVADIFVGKSTTFFADNRAELLLDTTAVALDTRGKVIRDSQARTIGYGKLLLATGGIPRTLDIPGGDLEGVCYYRYLDDYQAIRAQAAEGKTALVIGGGFIGSEIAAALAHAGLHVTMIFPDPYLVARVFPESLGRRLQEMYQGRGVEVLFGDTPVSLERSGATYVTRTKNGQVVGSDMIVVGVGIHPLTGLAEQAGLAVDNGIIVNEFLQSANPDIYAAGDNASFPYQALDMRTRVEHWDNALNQGKQAGRNMAGANEAYAYMPYFYSDLFEFGYEAVGEVDARLDTFADWQQDYQTGVIYYLREGVVRGVMLCNVWEKLDAARALIQRGEKMSPEELRGAIS